MSETSVKPFLATKMKCVVVSALISIAFVSQAFAVLRPLVPAKPAPPFNGELIITGDDPTQTPTGIVEIVSDYFPVPFYAGRAFCLVCISLSDRGFFVNGHIGCVQSG